MEKRTPHVYRVGTPAGEVYLKLTVIDDVLIVSFKEA
jgi:motility quorum-sensing regulator/GCU-specific mRNA interferase toxin